MEYPVLYYLSGLTCTHENAPMKSGFGKYAAKHKIAIVFPDTSPRGEDIEKVSGPYWIGAGAGFYLDATTDKYKKHFNMNTYIS
jgi:S-formylglutathione hydrolase